MTDPLAPGARVVLSPQGRAMAAAKYHLRVGTVTARAVSVPSVCYVLWDGRVTPALWADAHLEVVAT